MAGQYLLAASLLAAPLYSKWRLDRAALAWACGLAAGLLAGAILLGFFPACYVEGEGLTPFKIASEYAICLALAAAALHLHLRRDRIGHSLYLPMLAAIAFTILSEICFTLYHDVYDLANFTGHIVRIIAYNMVYRCLAAGASCDYSPAGPAD